MHAKPVAQTGIFRVSWGAANDEADIGESEERTREIATSSSGHDVADGRAVKLHKRG